LFLLTGKIYGRSQGWWISGRAFPLTPRAAGVLMSTGTKLRGAAAALVIAGQGAFIAVLLLSMVLARHLWLADLANFIRLHLLLLAVAFLVAGLLIGRRAGILGGVMAVIVALLPYAFLPNPASATVGPAFKLVSANILIHNPDPGRFLGNPEIADADIVVLQEMTNGWQDALIASGHWLHESSRDLPANTDMKIFSRFPILSEQTVSPESTDTAGRHAV